MKRPEAPVVSVIMSVYNGEQFLSAAIDSILEQRFEDFEFIIINDGSTDGTHGIIQKHHDARIILVNQQNQGLTKALNRGLQLARGKFIVRQDADDISLPARLLTQFEYLNSNKDISLVGSAISVIDEYGRKQSDYFYPSEHLEIVKRLFRGGNPLPHSTLMFRRDIVREIGGYNELFAKAQDVDLILRLVECSKISSIPEVLVKVRFRFDSFGGDAKYGEQWKYAMLAMVLAEIRSRSAAKFDYTSFTWQLFMKEFEKWFEKSGANRKFFSAKLRRVAKECIWRKEYIRGLYLLFTSVKSDPRWVFRYFVKRQIFSEKDIQEVSEIYFSSLRNEIPPKQISFTR